MKIKIKDAAYEEVLAQPVERHRSPVRPLWIFRLLLKLLSMPEDRHGKAGEERTLSDSHEPFQLYRPENCSVHTVSPPF